MGIDKIAESAQRYINTSLGDALFPAVRQRVLGYLFGQPERSFYASELIQLVGGGSGAVQRELARFAASGLVTVRQVGAQKHYQANRECPLYEELCGIVKKTFGASNETRSLRVTMSYQPDSRSRTAPAVAEEGVRYSLQKGFLIPPGRLRDLCRRFQVRKLSLFGSAVREDFKPDSDIDILVEFEPGQAPGLGGLVDLQKQLSELFDGRKVDLVTQSILNNPYRKKSVLKDLKTLYAA